MLPQPDIERSTPRRGHRGGSARTEPSLCELLRACADQLEQGGYGDAPISSQVSVFDVPIPGRDGKLAFIVSMMRRT